MAYIQKNSPLNKLKTKVIKKNYGFKGGQIGTGSSLVAGEIAGMAIAAPVGKMAIGVASAGKILAGTGAAIGGAAVGVGAAAGIRAAGNAIQQAVARKRVNKYGQEGSAIVPNKKITSGTGAGNAIKGTVRAFEGDKVFTGTASTVRGMRKDARHHRKNVDKATRVAKRNEAISIKNKRKTESAAISATKVKKTYKTTAQKVGGAIKGVLGGSAEKRKERKIRRATIKGIRRGA